MNTSKLNLPCFLLTASILPSLAMAQLPNPAVSQNCSVRLQGLDIDGNERMGAAVHLAGDLILSGAPGERNSIPGEIPGAVYVHSRNIITNEWNQVSKISPSSLGNRDQFGTSLDLDGLDLAVGAPGDQGVLATGPGKVYLMRNTGLGSTWAQQVALTPNTASTGDGFGVSVAIDGDFLLVGAPGDDTNGQNTGAAYLYKNVSGIWIQTQKIYAPSGVTGIGFGRTVSLDGILACVGGDQLGHSSVGSGVVVGYRMNSSQMLEELHVISPANLAAADFFGRSTDIDGDLLVVGAPGDDDAGSNAGAVYAFRYESSTREFLFEEKMTVLANSNADHLGESIDTDGSSIAAGRTGVNGTGGAVVFRHSPTGWNELRKVQPQDLNNSGFAGSDVAINGNIVLLGDEGDNSLYFGAGATFVVDVGMIDLDDNGVADLCEDLGTNYCGPAPANSTGQSGEISINGSPYAVDEQLTLELAGLPTFVFGIFITSQAQDFVANPGGSQGNLCLGGAIGRYNQTAEIFSSDAAGMASFTIDFDSTPTPTGRVSIQAGQTWNFQAWHRDTVNGQSASNFTDAISLTFQ